MIACNLKRRITKHRRQNLKHKKRGKELIFAPILKLKKKGNLNVSIPHEDEDEDEDEDKDEDDDEDKTYISDTGVE